MKKSEFQIMVYGPNISSSKVSITYPGVTLKEVVKAESTNYLFLYVNISKTAKPGNMPIRFTDGTATKIIDYPLKARAPATVA